ncbi:MAG: hypothetical protein ABI777_09115 [Betaproteobacteria bacterium]
MARIAVYQYFAVEIAFDTIDAMGHNLLYGNSRRGSFGHGAFLWRGRVLFPPAATIRAAQPVVQRSGERSRPLESSFDALAADPGARNYLGALAP